MPTKSSSTFSALPDIFKLSTEQAWNLGPMSVGKATNKKVWGWIFPKWAQRV